MLVPKSDFSSIKDIKEREQKAKSEAIVRKQEAKLIELIKKIKK